MVKYGWQAIKEQRESLCHLSKNPYPIVPFPPRIQSFLLRCRITMGRCDEVPPPRCRLPFLGCFSPLSDSHLHSSCCSSMLIKVLFVRRGWWVFCNGFHVRLSWWWCWVLTAVTFLCRLFSVFLLPTHGGGSRSASTSPPNFLGVT